MFDMLKRNWFYFSKLWKERGLLEACSYSLKYVSGNGCKTDPLPNPVDLYGYIFHKEFGQKSDQLVGNELNWVIPNFGIGSGGHLNIFRMVKKLEERGFTCRIIIIGETNFANGKEARKVIRKHFFELEAEVSIGRDALLPAVATFATEWRTAYTVRDFIGSGKKYYFVQDFEPDFFAIGSEHIFAENTYRFGFKAITAGSWLSDKLKKEYAMDAIPFNFSYDRELYKPYPRREPHIKRVFFYARSVTPRRAFELGLLTLTLLHKKMPEVEFVLAGWDMSGYSISFPFQNAGIVSLDELPDLYSQCDVALVLSLTNLSLLPLEVMACGCAVVSNKGKNVEWLLNENVTKFSELTPEDLSNALFELLNNESELLQLKQAGLEFSRTTDWDLEVNKIVKEIEMDFSL